MPPQPHCHAERFLNRKQSWFLFPVECVFKLSHREYFCFYSSVTCTQSPWSDLISFLQSDWYATPVSFTHSQFLNLHKQMPISKETISLNATARICIVPFGGITVRSFKITDLNFPSKIQYNLKFIYLSGNCIFIIALEIPGWANVNDLVRFVVRR